MLQKLALALIITLCAYKSNANISLPYFMSDNMVLQRDQVITIWGWADPYEKVEVLFKNEVKNISGDKEGRWKVSFASSTAGGPYELKIHGNNTILIKNILIGDVWLCSGQSNMEWTVAQSQNAAIEIEAAQLPMIRHIKVPKAINSFPHNNIESSTWEVCSPMTVGQFTAVGYFFAKEVYLNTKVPIGLLHSSWGGTNIETWISREGFEHSEEFIDMIRSMPRIDLDSLGTVEEQGTTKRIEKLQGVAINKTNAESMMEVNFDANLCPTMNVPQLWEEQSLGNMDGVVWFRKEIILDEVDAQKSGNILLSKIDDNDNTYINGIEIGSTHQWDAIRNYSLPKDILVAGKNVITIRVEDNTGGGGIYGDKNDMKLVLEDKEISLDGPWKYRVEAVKRSTNENAYPSLCFNAMINPLIGIGLKGILWYQGESNVGRAHQYQKAFPLLIEDWRAKFSNAQLPFYFVQLATFNNAGNSTIGCPWAELREAQTMTLKLPYTGMCVTTDVGNPTDIHPKDKKTVGTRLASIALKNEYGMGVPCVGPTFKSMKVVDGKVLAYFDLTNGPLMTPDKYGYIKGFEIAGEDQIFHFAQAYIEDDHVVLWNAKVKKPMAINFGWMGDASECNLFNDKGFPAIPFRSHDWHSTTTKVKYKIIVPNQ